MVLDYSKWDNLELSDDSDFEPHPNVDKRSFIRAKQNQIHQERLHRRHQIDTFKYERIINDGLLSRVTKLVEILQSHVSGSQNADEQVYHALMESMGNPSEDRPPPRPEGVHGNEPDQPTYSKMMAALVDQVKKEVDKSESENRRDEYTRHLRGHLGKIKDLQNQLENKLAELEREESRKITSDSIHTGFDSSFVNKADKKKPASKMESKKIETVEVLNPGVIKTGSSATAESGEQPSSSPQPKSKDGGDQDAAGDADDDSDIGPSELGKEFAKIKIGEYQRCLEFISKNPEIVNQRETDGLLAEAFEAQLDGKDEYARQCVHHALLLQYCRSLGKDGVGIFFKRVLTRGHKGQQVFYDDVSSTYARIRDRCKEIKKQRAANGSDKDVEQIQLHPVEPGTTINIVVPQPNSEDEVERQARAIFETFSPKLQKSLESGSLEEVNKVLGEMSIEDAEDVVGKFGDGGMLSLQEQIIDATTEEGQKQLKEIEAQAKHREDKKGTEEAIDDPA